MPDTHPLVLTLGLDPDTFVALDRLRRAHFPPERNVLPAHLTLFHALPGEREADVRAALADAAVCAPLPLTFAGVRSLGRGVAVVVKGAELVALRRHLAAAFGAWLTPQDRQPYRPHVTVQNKAAPDAARRLLEGLSAGWVAFAGRGESLLLWRYLGGPWELAEEFPLAALPPSPEGG